MLTRPEKPALRGRALYPLAAFAAQLMLWGGELLYGIFPTPLTPRMHACSVCSCRSSEACRPFAFLHVLHFDM